MLTLRKLDFFFFFLPELDLINPSSNKLVGNTIQNTYQKPYTKHLQF